jgi:glycosyltransferase involved in cell wall biosynthesis
MGIKVSVIIPVYNAEKYLAECIESLLGQTLKECEFIFVNDGSKDSSREILEDYKKRDSRIILINQKNQGVSIARNNGLKIASGDYLGFVDADDFIEEDMLEILYNSAKESDIDIVVSNIETKVDGCKIIVKYPFPLQKFLQKDFIQEEILPYFIKRDDLNSACNKIYSKKLIKDNLIRFPENTPLGEDGIFNIQAFCHARKVQFIDYTGYHYRETLGSATRNILENDYFSRAIEIYNSELPSLLIGSIGERKVQLLKTIKLVNSVMSLSHIYFKSTNDLSFRKRYKCVKNMIRNKYVKEALDRDYADIYFSLNRYEKILIRMIKKQLTVGIYFLTGYSSFRNKKWEVLK